VSKSPKIYFASDIHLGIPNHTQSLEREKKIVSWLKEIAADATEIFLLGDLFDFWFEYKHVVPKGYVRLLGTMANICDQGIPISIFTGNHDMWMFGYLEKEIGVKMYHRPKIYTWNTKKLMIGHGDGLGPGDKGYKMLKKLFSNKLAQWGFRILHPGFGIGIANYWSKRSRLAEGGEVPPFLGEDKEWLLQYCKRKLQQEHFDYFIFGHRHLPLDMEVGKNSRYINTGDWIKHFSYAVFDGHTVELKYYH
jgi:UDP-2,3-diacylglucosamine hydrolase